LSYPKRPDRLWGLLSQERLHGMGREDFAFTLDAVWF
jgi:hypothetical protein